LTPQITSYQLTSFFSLSGTWKWSWLNRSIFLLNTLNWSQIEEDIKAYTEGIIKFSSIIIRIEKAYTQSPLQKPKVLNFGSALSPVQFISVKKLRPKLFNGLNGHEMFFFYCKGPKLGAQRSRKIELIFLPGY
jgi:hypothetical protein